jgi:hypothetical protein
MTDRQALGRRELVVQFVFRNSTMPPRPRETRPGWQPFSSPEKTELGRETPYRCIIGGKSDSRAKYT